MEELIRIIFKWLKPIMLVAIIAAIVSAGISLLLPEIFQSSVTFIPTNPHMMDASNLFTRSSDKEPTYLFGGKNDIERLLTLSTSRGLESYIIDKFKLYEHYEIDTNDLEKDHWVTEELRGHFNVIKSPNNMLYAEVQDKDKNFAAEMANAIIARLDELNKNVIMEKKRTLTSLYETKVLEKTALVEQLRDSLNNTIKRNPKDTVNASILGKMVEDAVYKYLTISTINEQHQASLNQEYSTLYIIESAVPAVKRVKPVRSLIVITSTLLSIIAMIFIAIFIEKFKEFKLEEDTANNA